MLLDLVLGYECNLGCDYCTITPAMRRRNLSTAQARAAIERGRARGASELQLGGGEPTIRRDLVDLVAHGRALGFAAIKVQSNGLMLSYPEFLARLTAAGATKLSISVHAHEATRYHRLTRSDATFPLLERAIDQVVASGLPLECELIAKADTYRHLPEAARWLAGRGVRAVRLWLVSLTDGNRENLESLPRMSEVAPFFREVFEDARRDGRSAVSLHLPKCTLPGDEAHVVDPAAGGVLCVTPDAEFQLEESQLGGQSKPDSCRACREDHACRGVRRDYAERHGTAELIPLV